VGGAVVEKKRQKFTSPEGRIYYWDKKTPPTQEDKDAIVAYNDSLNEHPNPGTQYDHPIGPTKRPTDAPRDHVTGQMDKILRKQGITNFELVPSRNGEVILKTPIGSFAGEPNKVLQDFSKARAHAANERLANAQTDQYLNPDSEKPIPQLSKAEREKRVNDKQVKDVFKGASHTGGIFEAVGQQIKAGSNPDSPLNKEIAKIGDKLQPALQATFADSPGAKVASTIPGSKPLVKKLNDVQGSLVNPVQMLQSTDALARDPVGTAVDTGLAINNIWRSNDVNGKPVSIEDRVDGVVALVGTAMAAESLYKGLKAKMIDPALEKRALKRLAEHGLEPPATEPIKSTPKVAPETAKVTGELPKEAPKTSVVEPAKKSGLSNHSQTAALAEEFGFEPVSKSGTTLKEAQKTAVETGVFDRAEKLAHEALTKKKVFTDVEQVAVAMKGTELKTQFERAGEQLDKAIESGKGVEEARAHYDDLHGRLETVADAIDKSGSEWGRAGNARKIILNEVDPTDTFTMERKFKRESGRAPNEAEKAQIKALADENKALQDKLTAKEEEFAKLQAGDVVKSTRRVKRAPAEIHAEIDDLLKQYHENKREGTTIGAMPRLDIWAKQAPIIAKLANNYIQLGIQALPELVAKIKSHFPDLTDREVHDAIAGNYPKPPKKEVSEVAKVKGQVKQEARLESKLADLTEQLDTGNVRPPQSKQYKQATREIEDLRAKVKLAQGKARQYLANQRPQSFIDKTRTIIRRGGLPTRSPVFRMSSRTRWSALRATLARELRQQQTVSSSPSFARPRGPLLWGGLSRGPSK
jgi:hypothetical protein